MMRSSGAWRFEWIDGPAWGHADFSRAWAGARGRARVTSVYHDLRWLATWGHTVGAARGVRWLFGRASAAGQPDVYLPWMVAAHQGQIVSRSVIEYVGQEHSAYHDPLVDGDPTDVGWPSFWPAAREAVRGIADALLLRFVSDQMVDRGFARPTDPSPVIPLRDMRSLDDLLAASSANHRGDIRRRLRRLAEHGPVALWQPGPGQSAAAIDDFTVHCMPAYRQQWRDKGGGLLAHAGVEALLLRVLRDGLVDGWASYRALRLDGNSIAWALLLRDAHDDYWWVPTFDQAYDALGPGKAMLALLIEQAIAERRHAWHFLTGSQSYKMAWRPTVPPRSALAWHSASLRGRALAAYDAWRTPTTS
jgi:CelD/BcsL family acetyltransferase involved in cellulose biosynthesis